MDTSESDDLNLGADLKRCLAAWKIESFTDIQRLALEAGAADGESLFVSAPTSSGKTLVGEIAIFSTLLNGEKALYLVSHKALADQKYADFLAKFGEESATPLASIGLSTGDRDEGDANAQLLVATYEKALGLTLSGRITPSNYLVIADEFQIIGEEGRGAEIEILLSILRQRRVKQFIALTATVENGAEMAQWMNCKLVQSDSRVVPLKQEIWTSSEILQNDFGSSNIINSPNIHSSNNLNVVLNALLESSRGPVLVFTESKKESSSFASAFSSSRQRSSIGIALADQLELFSEPTDSSDLLRDNAYKRVAFHTADLSPQERKVIEDGFLSSQFDVCFATSTLAAGVNFPFRTVVFSKLTYQYGDRANTKIKRSEYRNMSGRAGRYGMHSDGFSVILPKNGAEVAYSQQLVLPHNDHVKSKMQSIILRRSILIIVSAGLAQSASDAVDFFQNTLYWHQVLKIDEKVLDQLKARIQNAVNWLVQNEFLNSENQQVTATSFGNATALSGILPTTAVQIVKMLRTHSRILLDDFDDNVDALIHFICSSDELNSEAASRFLPYQNKPMASSVTFWSSKNLLTTLDRSNLRLAQAAHAITLFVNGVPDKKISYETGISGGVVHKFASEVAWILDGMHKLACIPELGCSQILSNNISLLARRVRRGAPAEVLDLIHAAERHQVPGFGRQRAKALREGGISSLHDIAAATKEQLTKLLKNVGRVQALMGAALSAVGLGPNRVAKAHEAFAKNLKMESVVSACNELNGTDYEKAIIDLLSYEMSWDVKSMDEGGKQNEPDILLVLGEKKAIIECKTCTRVPQVVKKEDAWAVLQKSSEFDDSFSRVTLAKPRFEAGVRLKSASSKEVTLVEHDIFLEGVLRMLGKSISPDDFMTWLCTPGVAELERLGGRSTLSV